MKIYDPMTVYTTYRINNSYDTSSVRYVNGVYWLSEKKVEYNTIYSRNDL